MLVSKKSGRPNPKPDRPNTKPGKPNPSLQCSMLPQHKQVEYASRWVISHWHHVGHVDFMLFVSISFAFGSQHEPDFWLNSGLTNIKISPCIVKIPRICVFSLFMKSGGGEEVLGVRKISPSYSIVWLQLVASLTAC